MQNEPRISKEPQISRETKIMNAPQTFRKHQISKQIKNESEILKEP